MENKEAAKILRKDPEIQEVLKRAEAIQKAIDSLEGRTTYNDYQCGYEDGERHYKETHDWQDAENSQPVLDTEVVVKVADGGHFIAEYRRVFSPSLNTKCAWIESRSGNSIANVEWWKPLEDD